jgi:hypothetical protein
MDALNKAHESGETRPFWRRRMKAIALTLSTLPRCRRITADNDRARGGRMVRAAFDQCRACRHFDNSGLSDRVCASAYRDRGFTTWSRHQARSQTEQSRALFASAGIVIGSLLFSFMSVESKRERPTEAWGPW